MKYPFFLAVAFLAVSSISLAQDKKSAKAEKLLAAINDKSYIFYAESAEAAHGMAQRLTADYNVTVSSDELVSQLPYFGNSTSIPSDMTNSLLAFTSHKFEQIVVPGEKGSMRVQILFKDQPEIKSFLFTIAKSGYASLQTVVANRSQMSFNGSVDKK